MKNMPVESHGMKFKTTIK